MCIRDRSMDSPYLPSGTQYGLSGSSTVVESGGYPVLDHGNGYLSSDGTIHVTYTPDATLSQLKRSDGSIGTCLLYTSSPGAPTTISCCWLTMMVWLKAMNYEVKAMILKQQIELMREAASDFDAISQEQMCIRDSSTGGWSTLFGSLKQT